MHFTKKKKEKLTVCLFVCETFIPVVYFTILNLNLLSENCYEIKLLIHCFMCASMCVLARLFSFHHQNNYLTNVAFKRN